MTRRAVLAATVLAGTAGLSLSAADELLEQFAPLSGTVWDAARRTRPERVESPAGEATITVDDEGVPHVEADSEEAASFAVGYIQGFDRLFQLDLQRRVMRGQTAELAGEVAADGDEFHVRMDFVGAAQATWDVVRETPAGSLVERYTQGVNAALEDHALPLEFELLGYEPDPWTPVDSMLMEKQISWTLTGNFGELRRAVIADELDADLFEELYPVAMDHDVPILRSDPDHRERLGDLRGVADPSSDSPDESDTESTDARRPSTRDGSTRPTSTRGTFSRVARLETAANAPGRPLTDWLSAFESPPGVGSNSWVVSGEHTESGTPIMANDPHLALMTPPLWYEQHVETSTTSVRGVTFPGVPFVIIGANDRGGWGFTNVGADVLDCYTYEIDDDEGRYRYRDEWRSFETAEREIEISGAENRTITTRKTVHGPLLEREDHRVGVAWTGLSATRTTQAVYELTRSDGLEDALEAARIFDLPTQNLVYADADGRTLYVLTGRLPVREIEGEVVTGNRLFDGSEGEAEWAGFTPYGESSWDGFVPFEEQPHAIDPDVLGTANQRVADHPEHYVGVAYATPYRGRRIYDVLDEAADTGTPTDPAFHRDLQTDTRDERAVPLVPELLEAGKNALENGETELSNPATLESALQTLESWSFEMNRDERGALVFARWIDHFERAVFDPVFEDTDLDASYYPNEWVLETLSPDSPVFEGRSRAGVMVEALEDALEETDSEGWESYGDWNTTAPIAHPFGGEAPFLNYDERPRDGSRATVDNYRVESAVGASWRMVVQPGEAAWGIVPGGNSGEYFSPHYDDQFQRWADGEYKSMDLEIVGEETITFEEGSR
ncbi:penicillin acylase family protein [Natrialbaceae archaeon A-CW2]